MQKLLAIVILGMEILITQVVHMRVGSNNNGCDSTATLNLTNNTSLQTLHRLLVIVILGMETLITQVVHIAGLDQIVMVVILLLH